MIRTPRAPSKPQVAQTNAPQSSSSQPQRTRRNSSGDKAIGDPNGAADLSLFPGDTSDEEVPGKGGSVIHDSRWNLQFQQLVSLPDSDPTKHEQLIALAQDFAAAAKKWGALIILEQHLPDHEKTIPPISHLGGVAGGTKHVKDGILFKFSIDTPIQRHGRAVGWMYGGTECNHAAAMKASNQELIGFNQLFQLGIKDLHFPLVSLVTYLGYRLIAVSIVPVGRDTLVYGSDNQGKVVHASEPKVNELMRQVGLALNLRGHRVRDKKIYGPGDIEVHRGADGRFYVLDVARLMPPQAPTAHSPQRAIFFEHLRPEIVASNDVPLSSDAFSYFQLHDPHRLQLNEDVVQATARLLSIVLKSCARSICEEGSRKLKFYQRQFRAPITLPLQKTRDLLDFNYCPYDDSVELKEIDLLRTLQWKIHRHGANMRMLGYIRSHMLRIIRCSLAKREQLENGGAEPALSTDESVDAYPDVPESSAVRGYPYALDGLIVDFRVFKESFSSPLALGMHRTEKLLLVEACARCIKNDCRRMLRHQLATVSSADAPSYKPALVDYVNMLFGNSESSQFFWKSTLTSSPQSEDEWEPTPLKVLLLRGYYAVLTRAESEPSFDLRTAVNLRLLMFRVQELADFQLSSRFTSWRLTLRQHALTSSLLKISLETVQVSDIVELTPSVKHMDLFNYAAAQFTSGSLILRRSRHDWNIEKLHTALTSADKATTLDIIVKICTIRFQHWLKDFSGLRRAEHMSQSSAFQSELSEILEMLHEGFSIVGAKRSHSYLTALQLRTKLLSWKASAQLSVDAFEQAVLTYTEYLAEHPQQTAPELLNAQQQQNSQQEDYLLEYDICCSTAILQHIERHKLVVPGDTSTEQEVYSAYFRLARLFCDSAAFGGYKWRCFMSGHAHRILDVLVARDSDSLVSSMLEQSRNIHVHIFEVQTCSLILLLLVELQVILPYLEQAEAPRGFVSNLLEKNGSWFEIVSRVSRWTLASSSDKPSAGSRSDELLASRASDLKATKFQSSSSYCVWLIGMFALEYCFLQFQDHKYELDVRRQGALENVHDLIGLIGTRLEASLKSRHKAYQKIDLEIVCVRFQQARLVLLLASLSKDTPLLRDAVAAQLKSVSRLDIQECSLLVSDSLLLELVHLCPQMTTIKLELDPLFGASNLTESMILRLCTEHERLECVHFGKIRNRVWLRFFERVRTSNPHLQIRYDDMRPNTTTIRRRSLDPKHLSSHTAEKRWTS